METVPGRKNNLPILVLAVFILFSLGVVIFLYHQNQELKSMLLKYRSQTPLPNPTPVIIEKTASPSATPLKLQPSPSLKLVPTP